MAAPKRLGASAARSKLPALLRRSLSVEEVARELGLGGTK